MRLQFILAEVFQGLRRNATMVISVILVTFVSLTFVGAAALLQVQVAKLKGDWYDLVEVSVFLCPEGSTAPTCAEGEASEDQVAAVERTIETDLGDVVATTYFESKAEAFAAFEARYPDGYQGTQLTEDDMQASFRLKLSDPEQYQVVDDVLSGRGGVEVVEDQRAAFEPLFLALNRASLVAVGLAAVMLLAAALLIITTIRLSAVSRQRETGIMRLVGASTLFVQLPFMLEGAIAALIGAILAVAGLWAAVQFLVVDWLAASLDWVDHVSTTDVLAIAPLLLVVAVVLAGVSSAVTLHRYTRV